MTTQEITEYIFIDDKDPQGSIALVFGTWNARKYSVEKAVELYKKGNVPKLVFSGGYNEKAGGAEGEILTEDAIRLGIPSKDILIENRSKNTLENVLFSIDIIDKEIGLRNIKSIIAVVKNYHARRVLMTLKKHLPQYIQLKVSSYTSDYYSFTKDNWHQSDLGKKKVFEEMEKINTYLAKGDIAEL
jgi:uncharacterized SAM-binding protein YcdF (DUF218 family)